MKRFILLLLLAFHLSLFSFSIDFGMVLDQDFGIGGTGSESRFDYSGIIVPHVLGLIGNNGDYYISAGFEIDHNEDTYFALELLRTEFTFNFGNLDLLFGRMYHSDPLDFIASGLFDGAKVSYDMEWGRFSLGAWYTGLLYKNRALIAMTTEEHQTLAEPVRDSYFAPKRFLTALGWERFGMGKSLQANISFLGQFDLAGDNKLHSQYLAGKLSLPLSDFSFDLGGCVELIQADSTNAAFAAEAGISYVPPITFKNEISLLARYSSGGSDSGMKAFLPLTIIEQGNILEAKLSGLTLIELDYIASINETVSAGLTSSYFIRNDLSTYKGYPVKNGDNSGYLLGNEFSARLLWSPYSDFSLNLEGGVFLPSMGNVNPDADNLWHIGLNVILSF